jgi:hypothetical protein
MVAALVVAGTLGVLIYVSTPDVYESSTTMVLTTTEYGGTLSQDPSQPTALTNPMLNFNDSLRTTSAILIQAMGTKDVARELGVIPPTQMVVDDGRSNPSLLGLNGPFLFIKATSPSSQEAERIVHEAEKLVQRKLHEWQAALHAPDRTYVNLVSVVSPTAPVAQRGQATKLAMMAAVFGFAISLGVAYVPHWIGTRRRARAARAESAPKSKQQRGRAGRLRPSTSPVDAPADGLAGELVVVPPSPPTASPRGRKPRRMRRNGAATAVLETVTEPRPPEPAKQDARSGVR